MTPPDGSEPSSISQSRRDLARNRPDKGNAIDEAWPRISPERRPRSRNGRSPRRPIRQRAELYSRRRSRPVFRHRARPVKPAPPHIDSYHLAIELLTSIDAPSSAVHSGAGGGGLSLLYAADRRCGRRRSGSRSRALGLTGDGGDPRSCRAWSDGDTRRSCSCSTVASPHRKRRLRILSPLAADEAVETEAAPLAGGPTRA